MLDNINLIKKQIDTDFLALSFIDEAKELYDKLKEQYDDLNKEYSDLSSAFEERKYYAELMSFYDIKVLPLVARFKNSENTSIFDNRDKELNSKIDNALEYIESVIEHLKERFPKLAVPIIKKFETMQKEYEANIAIGLKKLKNNDSIKFGINDDIMLTTLGTPDAVQKLYLKDLELFSDIYLNDTKKIFEVSSKIDEIYENCSQLKDIIITDDSLKKDGLDLFDKIKKYYNDYKLQVDNILNEIDLNMVSNLLKLLNQKLLDFKKFEEKMDILHKQKLSNDRYKSLSEDLDSLNFYDIKINQLKNIEKIVSTDENDFYFNKLKANFYEKCFFITVYQYSTLEQSYFYNSLTEYSKEIIGKMFIEMVNEKIHDTIVKREILKEYLNNGFNKDMLSKIFNLIINRNVLENRDITFLTYNQIFGENKLKLFDKYQTIASLTDFAFFLGGFVSIYSDHTEKHISNWWTKSTSAENSACVVDEYGCCSNIYVDSSNVGVRPVLSYSAISKISLNKEREHNSIFEIEYGEYPQYIVSEDLASNLENSYCNEEINQTGKSYTTICNTYQDTDASFQLKIYNEYEYEGKKYIRFVSESDYNGKLLSDGRKVEIGKAYWIEVKPIVWLVDKESDIVISKDLIFSGVKFNRTRNYKGDFENTFIKWFMNNYFVKEIKSIMHIAELKEQLNKTK